MKVGQSACVVVRAQNLGDAQAWGLMWGGRFSHAGRGRCGAHPARPAGIVVEWAVSPVNTGASSYRFDSEWRQNPLKNVEIGPWLTAWVRHIP